MSGPPKALLVYDAKALEVVKRVPMKRSMGKYNVYNKSRYVEGTNHQGSVSNTNGK